MKLKNKAGLTLMVSILLSACGNNTSTSESGQQALAQSAASGSVYGNQLGFKPNHPKFLVVPELGDSTFSVKALDNEREFLTGALPKAKSWQPAGGKRYQTIDLSLLTQEGEYVVNIVGSDVEYRFSIADGTHLNVHDAALKSFYLNRASLALDAAYAMEFERPAGHPDDNVLVHPSAATQERPAGTSLSSPKGWYDAGDFGKYVVNSGIATYTLLAAYQNFSEFYQKRDIGIPESNNGIPDILDEIKWNLDWMYTMQDSDGGVYHKLTTLEWPGIEMPAEDTRQRFMIGKTTSATLDYAATLAFASRIYRPHLSDGTPNLWLDAAVKAWDWAQQNPAVYYVQPTDVKSGEYGDDDVKDEFTWAAIELYLATKETKYLQAFNNLSVELTPPAWQYVSALPYISLLNSGDEIDQVLREQAKSKLLVLADRYLQEYEDNPFKVAMVTSDFVWGSNSVALNKGWVLAEAFEATGQPEYRAAALGAVDYVLGQNPLALSYVTGFGDNAVNEPHHRASAADNVKDALPGMLAGGPQPGQQDKCDYQSNNAAESYVDDWCSYASNEIAINWNAPLVYMLAFKNQN